MGAGPFGAAIFDCDGLLVDTASCWRGAYMAAAAQVGLPLAGLLLPELNGASIESAAEHLSRTFGCRVSAAFLRQTLEEEVRKCRHELLPGVAELLDALNAMLPLAVASNAPLPVVETVLEAVGARPFFSEVVTPDAVPSPKPAPDIYLEACLRLSVDPDDAIAFEDSSLGAEAARSAGIHLVAVPTRPDEEIEAEIRAERLDDPRILTLLGVPQAP